jgi:hypothetical protein
MSTVMLFAQKKHPPLAAIILFIFLGLEAIMHARMIGVLVAVTAPIIITRIEEFSAILEKTSHYGRNVLMVSSLVILIIFSHTFASTAFGSPWHPPERALHALSRFPSLGGSHALVDFNLAGSAIGIDPTRKIFAAGYRPHGVDESGWGPTEAYLDMTIRERGAWKIYFERYNIDTVLLQKTPLDLATHDTNGVPTDRTMTPPKWVLFTADILGLNKSIQQFSLAADIQSAGWCVVYRDQDAQILRSPKTPECE